MAGITKGLAVDLAPNVRVNCVAPGLVGVCRPYFLTAHLMRELQIDTEVRTYTFKLPTRSSNPSPSIAESASI
jgi:NAD(P)-dependent dehydrogenase (short-subunit alcohol dehydrogenase family)